MWAIQPVEEPACLLITARYHLVAVLIGQVRVDHLARTFNVTIRATHD
jgi:hypothetical protein